MHAVQPTYHRDSGEKVVRRKRGMSVISELQSDSSKFLAPSSNNASATTPLPRRDRSGFAAAPHASNTSTTVFTSLQHSGSSYSPRSFLNSLSRESENEPPKSPLKQTRKNEKKEGCDEYTTRLMLVVVSSLGKIAAKCPELLHRVSVSLSKVEVHIHTWKQYSALARIPISLCIRVHCILSGRLQVLGFEEYFPLVVMEKVKVRPACYPFPLPIFVRLFVSAGNFAAVEVTEHCACCVGIGNHSS